MARKIYEHDKAYSLLRFVTDAHILSSFRRYRFVGRDKLPKDGPIIYAPNHCDALMDPLTVLTLNHDDKVFVARADVFNNGFIHKILTFFKMMPINRRRDGLRNMTRTAETIDKSIDVLANGVDFCILPEGTHRSMHSLLPIGKGIARIACGAAARMPEGTPLYIVPVGIEYGDYYRFRNTMLAQIGEAINVTELLSSNAQMSEKEAMDLIRAKVGEGIKEKIVYINDDEDYDAVWELSRIESGKIPGVNLIKRFKANKAAVAKVTRFHEEQPQAAQRLYDRARAFEKQRLAAKVSLGSLHRNRSGIKALLCTLLAIVTLPIFLVAATVSLPIWVASELLVRNLEDRTFCNSFRCVVITFGWTLLLIIWAIVLLCCLKWYWALLAIATIVPAPYAVYDYFELVRMTASHWRCLFNKKLRTQYNNIADELKKI